MRLTARVEALERDQGDDWALNHREESQIREPEFFSELDHLRKIRHFPEFARRMLKIKDKETRRLVPFELNWIQRQILAAELRARHQGKRPWFLILKYRRGGVTTLQQGLCYHLMWSQPHTEVRTYAHRAQDTRTIFQMVGLFYDFQPHEYRHPKTQASTYHLEFPAPWYSVYLAETAGATSSGRGAGFDRVHLSEAASCPDLGMLHEGLSDTVTPEGAYVVESTPNGTTGKGADFFEAWTRAVAGESAFIPLFFPWHADPRNRSKLIVPDELGQLSAEEEHLSNLYHLDLEQVKWWRQKRLEIVGLGRSERAVLAEHPSDPDTCFLEGGDGYYDEALVKAAESRCVEPIRTEQNGKLRIFEDPHPDGRYLITADPAEGVGRDDSAATGWNVATGRQAFTWRFNRMPPDQFGVRLADLGRRWRPSADSSPAYVLVERENHGHAVLIGLMQLAGYPKAEVHHEVPETHDEKKPQPRAGWRHNHIVLTTALGRMLREEYPVILDREVIASIRRVSLDERGTAEFSGRDLAVTAGLAAIGFPYAVKKELFY